MINNNNNNDNIIINNFEPEQEIMDIRHGDRGAFICNENKADLVVLPNLPLKSTGLDANKQSEDCSLKETPKLLPEESDNLDANIESMETLLKELDQNIFNSGILDAQLDAIPSEEINLFEKNSVNIQKMLESENSSKIALIKDKLQKVESVLLDKLNQTEKLKEKILDQTEPKNKEELIESESDDVKANQILYCDDFFKSLKVNYGMNEHEFGDELISLLNAVEHSKKGNFYLQHNLQLTNNFIQVLTDFYAICLEDKVDLWLPDSIYLKMNKTQKKTFRKHMRAWLRCQEKGARLLRLCNERALKTSEPPKITQDIDSNVTSKRKDSKVKKNRSLKHTLSKNYSSSKQLSSYSSSNSSSESSTQCKENSELEKNLLVNPSAIKEKQRRLAAKRLSKELNKVLEPSQITVLKKPQNDKELKKEEFNSEAIKFARYDDHAIFAPEGMLVKSYNFLPRGLRNLIRRYKPTNYSNSSWNQIDHKLSNNDAYMKYIDTLDERDAELLTLRARQYMITIYMQNFSANHAKACLPIRHAVFVQREINSHATNPKPIKAWTTWRKIRLFYEESFKPFCKKIVTNVKSKCKEASIKRKRKAALKKMNKQLPKDDDYNNPPPPPPPPPFENNLITKKFIIKNHEVNVINIDDTLRDIYNDSTKFCEPLVIDDITLQYLPSFTLQKAVLPCAIKNVTTPFKQRGSTYEETPQSVYPMLFPITAMQSPMNTGPNFDACISVRILGATYPKSEDKVWNLAKEFFPPCDIEENITKEEWRNSLKPYQQQRLNEIELQLQTSTNLVDKRTKVFCKTDEMIPVTDKFVPRFIANVSPFYLYEIGYEIHLVQEAVKKMFNGFNPFTFKTLLGEVTIYPMFACGATAETLDKVWNFWLYNGFKGVMVMGDDSLFFDPAIGSWETDYSKFDASQKRGEALSVFPAYLRSLHMDRVADVYEDMYNQDIVPFQPMRKAYRAKDVGANVELQELWNKKQFSMRLTGEPATCLANSLVNLYAAINCWNDAEAFGLFGLQVKFRASEHVTFLKGTFLDNLYEEKSWIRLPSFLLKFGKVLTNPTLVFPNVPYHKAVKMLLRAQWLGYGEIGRTNWFYKAIEEQIYRLTESSTKELKLNPYHVFIDNKTYIKDEVFNHFMMERYSITESDMHSYITFLKQIKDIPCIYTHPIMNKLMYDYV